MYVKANTTIITREQQKRLLKEPERVKMKKTDEGK